MSQSVEFTLKYSGYEADDNEIDLYDVAQALIGFQRSLALTTHLILNDEIITQAPSLKGAQILASLPEDGSWKLPAVVLISGMFAVGTAEPDTPIGHLVRSAYDYVIHETLGFHVDFDKTLGQQYEELKRRDAPIPTLGENRFDSLIEKCEVAIRDMHRPIYGSGTANQANIIAKVGSEMVPFEHPLNYESYEYIQQTKTLDYPEEIEGRVSSYNSNTFNGRFFVLEEGRPVPFVLLQDARNADGVAKIMESMTMYTRYQFNRESNQGFIKVRAFKNLSKTDRLKSISIVKVLEI